MRFTHDTSSNLKTGNRADWGDEIWNISNDEIPVLSQISRNNDYISTEHKWFTEYLEDRDSSDAAANVEGGSDTVSTNPRYSCINYNMIFKKSAFVSRTQEKQLKAGVFSELEHQLFNKMLVLRQSVEQAILCRVRKRTSQENSTAGLMSGIPGLVGLYADQSLQVNGTTRTYGSNNTVNISINEDSFSATGAAEGQDDFDTMLMKLKKLGGDITTCACSFEDKKFVSSTWDIENKTRQSQDETKIQKLVLVYETDFGFVRFIPTLSFAKWRNVAADRFDGQGGAEMITDFAILMNPATLELQVFDDFFTEDVPTALDGKQRRAIFEGTLELSAPVGTGVFNFSGSTDYTRASANSRLPVTAAGYAA
jgi:hypothetical protein